MELHICPSSAQVSGKTFETNETNTTTPSSCWYSKAQLGLYRKWSNTKEGHIIPLSIVSIFACSFPDFEHETDKAKYAYLDPLAILCFYTEPPIGNAKVIIIIGIRIVFWIFNTKYLIFCLFCIVVRSVSRLKGGLISKYWLFIWTVTYPHVQETLRTKLGDPASILKWSNSTTWNFDGLRDRCVRAIGERGEGGEKRG